GGAVAGAWREATRSGGGRMTIVGDAGVIGGRTALEERQIAKAREMRRERRIETVEREERGDWARRRRVADALDARDLGIEMSEPRRRHRALEERIIEERERRATQQETRDAERAQPIAVASRRLHV